MLDIRQVQAFVAVVEEQNFTRAAKRLHIGQSGLSQQIKKLERAVGGPLFVRSSRQVEITALGTSLYGPAQQVLASVEHFERTADDRGTKRVLTLGVAENGVNGLAVELLTRVRSAFPDTDLEILRVTLLEQHQAVGADVEAVLARPPYAGRIPDGVVETTVTDDPVVVVVHAGHPAVGRSEVLAADVASWPRLAPAWIPDAWRQRYPVYGQPGDAEVKVVPEITTFRDAYARVLIDRTACVMPASFASTYNLSDAAVLPILDVDPMTITLLTASANTDEIVTGLGELMRAAPEDQPPVLQDATP